MATRDTLAETFLARHGWGGAARAPIAGDASARRYERLRRAAAPPESAVLMDDPPPGNTAAAFVAVAGMLRRAGLSAPEIYAADTAEGFMLLEDFGDDSFAGRLDGGGDAATFCRLAVDTLVALHRRFDPSAPAAKVLPVYDPGLFVGQLMLFPEAYVPRAVGRALGDDALADFAAAWQVALPAAWTVPRSLLLRDFHAGNLMYLDGRPGVGACGLLDFQDAGLGPVTYDLVSLLEDARRDLPDDVRREAIARYCAAFPGLDQRAFEVSCAVMAAMRHMRVLAVFSRLATEGGKPRYLQHLPRVWRLLEARLVEPALAPVRGWLDRHLPVARRIAPPLA